MSSVFPVTTYLDGLCPVLCPVTTYLDGLGVADVFTESHEDLGHELRHVVGEGLDHSTQPQHPGVAEEQVLREHCVTVLLLQPPTAPLLKLTLSGHNRTLGNTHSVTDTTGHMVQQDTW